MWAITRGWQGLLTGPAAGPIRSLAVLPLHNLSTDPEQEYFADGMTEQLIADLAKIDGLRVISPTTAMHYRNAPNPVRTVGRELQVDAVIEGSVIRAGDRVRVTARLVRGVTGDIIWTESFERDLPDVLALQSDVARAISRNVDVSLTSEDQARLASAPPVNPVAHREVLLGRHHAAKATGEGLRKAVQHFDNAIAHDSTNASAHAGLADAYTQLGGFYADPRDVLPKARRAAEIALRLDETAAEGHAALVYVHLVYDWNGPAAAKSLLRALDLNPTLARARLN